MQQMMNNSKELDIDCVALKRELQERLYDELQPESARDYFEKLSRTMDQSSLWQEALKRNSMKSAA